VTFNEDKSQVRTRNTPAVLAAVRDLIRSALKLAGHINVASARRAHTDRHQVLALYGITRSPRNWTSMGERRGPGLHPSRTCAKGTYRRRLAGSLGCGPRWTVAWEGPEVTALAEPGG